MRLSNKTLLIIVGSTTAAFLQIISRILQSIVIDLSAQNMFGFANLIYVIAPIWFLVLGAVQSSILIRLGTLRSFLLASFVIALVVSMVYLKDALSMYFRFDNFHETYFKSDIFQICSNLIIFPLIGFVIWKIKNHLDNN